MNALRAWLKAATPQQRARLAKLASTTPGALHQAAGAYKNKGKLRMSAQLAIRLDHATKGELKRSELSPACGQCEYAKRCERKGKP